MSKFKLTQTAAEVQDILNNCNGLKSDAEGNLTVNKDLGVDGKLTLKSLVSASNPDGDITKELGKGGGEAITLYRHFIRLIGKSGSPVDIISFDLYTTNSAKMEWKDLYKYVHGRAACSGYVRDNSNPSLFYFANALFTDFNGSVNIFATNSNWAEKSIRISSSDHRIDDEVRKVQ